MRENIQSLQRRTTGLGKMLQSEMEVPGVQNAVSLDILAQ